MNKSRLSVLLIMLLLIFFVHCKKTKDYRDDYTGDYNFTINVHYFNFTDSTYYDSTTYYSGSISKTDQQNCITMCYLPKSCLGASVSQSGDLSKPPNAGLGYGFSGKFESTDKVLFEYYFYGTTQKVTGYKR